MPQLIKQTVVVNSQQMNPSTHDALWMVTRDIFKEKDLTGSRISTPVLSICQTNDIQIQVLPDRLQVYRLDPTAQDNMGVDVTKKIKRNLGSAEIRSLGFNFHWDLGVSLSDIPKFSRDMFLRDNTPFFQAVGGDVATAGLTLIRPALNGGMLKFVAEPTYEMDDVGTPVTGFIAHFNYHFSIFADASDPKVDQALNQRQDAFDDAARLVKTLV